MQKDESPPDYYSPSLSAQSRRAARLGGASLIGASLSLAAQLALIYPALPALIASDSGGILSLGNASTGYGAFVSAIVALDLFGIVAFGAWYLLLRGENVSGALSALLLGVVALAIDLAVDLPIRFAEISAAGEYAAATTDAQRGAIAVVFQFMLDFSNYSLIFSTFILGLAFLFLFYAMRRAASFFGRYLAYLALFTGVLLVAEVPLSLPSNATGFLVVYLAASLEQIAFFTLAGRRMFAL